MNYVHTDKDMRCVIHWNKWCAWNKVPTDEEDITYVQSSSIEWDLVEP